MPFHFNLWLDNIVLHHFIACTQTRGIVKYIINNAAISVIQNYMKYLLVCLTLFACACATDFYTSAFGSNEGKFGQYIDHAWRSFNGTDAPVPLSQAHTGPQLARDAGIIPAKSSVNLTVFDTNKDGMLSHQELYDGTKKRMMNLDANDAQRKLNTQYTESNLRALHENTNAGICNSTITSTLTLSDAKSCVESSNCPKHLSCSPPTRRLQKRNFWKSLLKFFIAAVRVALTIFFIALTFSPFFEIGITLLGAWIAINVALELTHVV